MHITTYFTNDKETMIAKEVSDLAEFGLFEPEYITEDEFAQMIRTLIPTMTAEAKTKVQEVLHLMEKTDDGDEKLYYGDTLVDILTNDEGDKKLLIDAYSNLLHKKMNITEKMEEITMNESDGLLLMDGFFDSFLSNKQMIRVTELVRIEKVGEHRKYNIIPADSLRDVFEASQLRVTSKITVQREENKRYLVMVVEKANGEKQTSVIVPLKWIKKAVRQDKGLQDWITVEDADSLIQ